MAIISAIGIDVSKNTLDFVFLPGGKPMQVMNNSTGIAKLVKMVSKLAPGITVLEATGGYQDQAVLALHEAGLPVKVLNPRQVRDFARSLNRLGKTDVLDAKTLAEYALSRELVPDAPKAPELNTLCYLLTRRDQLQLMITAEKSHLEHAPAKYHKGIFSLMEQLKSNLHLVDNEIKEIINQNEAYSNQDKIIQSIPGIGPVVSSTLLAYLPELKHIGRKQVCALVGVAPFNRDSGQYRGQRHIFGGRAQVRKALYSAMRACLRFNPVVKAWFDRFISAGKPYKVAVIACVRKLLVVMRSMLLSEKAWDPGLHQAALSKPGSRSGAQLASDSPQKHVALQAV